MTSDRQKAEDQSKAANFQNIQQQFGQEEKPQNVRDNTKELLVLYDLERKAYDDQGITHIQSSLLRAFCAQLEKVCPELKKTLLLKTLGLFSSLLMFRELELVIWSCFSLPTRILGLAEEYSRQTTNERVKQLLNHLVNTAYYCKRQLTADEDFEAFKTFFNNYFQIFEGKHTEWQLLNEPDISQITPQVVNLRFEELQKIFENEIQPTEDLINMRDYNKMVEKLSEESMKDAHNIYIARLKKGVERERVMLRREIKKREEKLKEKQRAEGLKKEHVIRNKRRPKVFAGKGSSFGVAEVAPEKSSCNKTVTESDSGRFSSHAQPVDVVNHQAMANQYEKIKEDQLSRQNSAQANGSIKQGSERGTDSNDYAKRQMSLIGVNQRQENANQPALAAGSTSIQMQPGMNQAAIAELGGVGSLSTFMNSHRKVNLSLNNQPAYYQNNGSLQGGQLGLPQNPSGMQPMFKNAAGPTNFQPNEATLSENMNFLSLQSRIFEMHHLMNSINVGEGAQGPNNSFKTPLPFLMNDLQNVGYNPGTQQSTLNSYQSGFIQHLARQHQAQIQNQQINANTPPHNPLLQAQHLPACYHNPQNAMQQSPIESHPQGNRNGIHRSSQPGNGDTPNRQNTSGNPMRSYSITGLGGLQVPGISTGHQAAANVNTGANMLNTRSFQRFDLSRLLGVMQEPTNGKNSTGRDSPRMLPMTGQNPSSQPDNQLPTPQLGQSVAPLGNKHPDHDGQMHLQGGNSGQMISQGQKDQQQRVITNQQNNKSRSSAGVLSNGLEPQNTGAQQGQSTNFGLNERQQTTEIQMGIDPMPTLSDAFQAQGSMLSPIQAKEKREPGPYQ